MNWLNKLERKFGRYAVPNLIVYLIGAYSVGFVLNMVAPNILGFLNFQPYYILHGQIWRLITWILMPTDSNIIFLLIMMMFYYQLGTALERAWGTFRFNAYIIGGILLTEVGSVWSDLSVYGWQFCPHCKHNDGTDDQYFLYQYVYIPCICDLISGYAGVTVLYHSDKNEMDGSRICCYHGIQRVGYLSCDLCIYTVCIHCIMVCRDYAVMHCDVTVKLPHFLPVHEESEPVYPT